MFSGPVAWKLDRGKAVDEPKSLVSPIDAPGVFNVQFTDAITVSMSTNMETHKEITEKDAPVVEGLVGIYWNIDESPTFKRDIAGGGPLFIMKSAKDGWFICTNADPEHDENRVAWLKGEFPIGNDGSNGNVHVPFWARKKCAALSICSQHMFAEQSAQELHELLETYQAVETVSLDAASSDGVVKTRQKDKEQQSTKSGWLNKCAKLLMAIDNNDWSTVYSLAGEYKHVDSMKRVLDNTASYSNKKYKGRGW